MPLNDQEKVKLRHHLGYLNVAQAQTFVLGSPAAVETQFIIEGAMNKVLDAALPELRRQMAILDKIEDQLIDDQELLAVDVVGEITIRKTEMRELRTEYQYWRHSVANILGIFPNPFDKRFWGSSGVNVPVSH